MSISITLAIHPIICGFVLLYVQNIATKSSSMHILRASSPRVFCCDTNLMYFHSSQYVNALSP